MVRIPTSLQRGPRRAATSPRALPLLLAAALAACSGEGDPRPEEPAAADSLPAAGRPVGRSYERTLAFLTAGGDSALAVVWMIGATSRPGGVDRTARAWLVRGGEWEPFLDDRWSTPPTRAPWRVLPHGAMRIVVADDEALERILYSAGTRELEVTLDAALVDWTGRNGGTFRLLEGGLLLGGSRSEGLLVDIARSAGPGEAVRGDWAFLVGGPALQIVMHAPDSGTNLFQGWARLDFRDLAFTAVEIEPSETRAFDPARREVPVAWTVRSPDGSLSGTLEVSSATLEAGEGDGPQLPVDAVFEVSGTLAVEGAEHAVRGLFRHTQG